MGVGYKPVLLCSPTKRDRAPKRQRNEDLKQLTLILKAGSSGHSCIEKQVTYKSKSLGSKTPCKGALCLPRASQGRHSEGGDNLDPIDKDLAS